MSPQHLNDPLEAVNMLVRQGAVIQQRHQQQPQPQQRSLYSPTSEMLLSHGDAAQRVESHTPRVTPVQSRVLQQAHQPHQPSTPRLQPPAATIPPPSPRIRPQVAQPHVPIYSWYKFEPRRSSSTRGMNQVKLHQEVAAAARRARESRSHLPMPTFQVDQQQDDEEQKEYEEEVQKPMQTEEDTMQMQDNVQQQQYEDEEILPPIDAAADIDVTSDDEETKAILRSLPHSDLKLASPEVRNRILAHDQCRIARLKQLKMVEEAELTRRVKVTAEVEEYAREVERKIVRLFRPRLKVPEAEWNEQERRIEEYRSQRINFKDLPETSQLFLLSNPVLLAHLGGQKIVQAQQEYVQFLERCEQDERARYHTLDREGWQQWEVEHGLAGLHVRDAEQKQEQAELPFLLEMAKQKHASRRLQLQKALEQKKKFEEKKLELAAHKKETEEFEKRCIEEERKVAEIFSRPVDTQLIALKQELSECEAKQQASQRQLNEAKAKNEKANRQRTQQPLADPQQLVRAETTRKRIRAITPLDDIDEDDFLEDQTEEKIEEFSSRPISCSSSASNRTSRTPQSRRPKKAKRAAPVATKVAPLRTTTTSSSSSASRKRQSRDSEQRSRRESSNSATEDEDEDMESSAHRVHAGRIGIGTSVSTPMTLARREQEGEALIRSEHSAVKADFIASNRMAQAKVRQDRAARAQNAGAEGGEMYGDQNVPEEKSHEQEEEDQFGPPSNLQQAFQEVSRRNHETRGGGRNRFSSYGTRRVGAESFGVRLAGVTTETTEVDPGPSFVPAAQPRLPPRPSTEMTESTEWRPASSVRSLFDAYIPPEENTGS